MVVLVSAESRKILVYESLEHFLDFPRDASYTYEVGNIPTFLVPKRVRSALLEYGKTFGVNLFEGWTS